MIRRLNPLPVPKDSPSGLLLRCRKDLMGAWFRRDGGWENITFYENEVFVYNDGRRLVEGRWIMQLYQNGGQVMPVLYTEHKDFGTKMFKLDLFEFKFEGGSLTLVNTESEASTNFSR